jgi:hypothetical protein
MINRMNVGFILIAGRKPPNFKDLSGETFGALRCDSESGTMNSNKRWNTTCLCCDHKKLYATYRLKQGRCTNCKATKVPAQNQVA